MSRRQADLPMKLLGGNDDGGGRGPPVRSKDDAAVGYVYQRPHEAEFSQFVKQTRWASGDDAIIEVRCCNFFIYSYIYYVHV